MRPPRVPAIIAAIATCLFFANGCFWGGGDDEIPFPELTPFSPALTSRVHEIRDRASQIRGLPVYQKAEEGTLSADALKTYQSSSLGELTPQESADLDAYGVALKLLGVVDDNADIRKIFGEESSSVIAGLYLYTKDKLGLIGAAGGDLSTQDEVTLAHEYTHSFQDGAFDLSDFIKKYEESDLQKDGYAQYSDTVRCVFEGDATLTEEKYAEQFIGADWRDKIQAETPADAVQSVESIPSFLVRAFTFDYLECPDFIRAIQEEGGWEAVNALYKDPPATTEQVLHPDKYKSHELASTHPPGALLEQMKGWRLLSSAGFGEFDVYNWALTLTGDPGAAIAAGDGWGSGWLRTYRDEKDGSRAVVQLSLGWDTQQDVLEFLAVYDAILKGLGAQVQPISEGNVRWTAPGQFGVLTLDKTLDRVEIRLASDADGLKTATSDLKQFNQ